MRSLLRSARAVLPPMAVYWLFVALMVGSFTVAAAIGSPTGESAILLGVLVVLVLVGVLAGQVLALLRVRDWVVVVGTLLWWAGGSLVGALAGSSGVGAVVLAFVWLLPIFVAAGLWSLRVNRALLAAWLPIMFASGTAIEVAERSGDTARWMAGEKWAVWDLFTFADLALAVVLLLAYMVVREQSRLEYWRAGRNAPLEAALHESGRVRSRPTLLGWLLLCALAVVLAVGTAVLSPYLWRTGPEETTSSQTDPGQTRQAGGEGRRAHRRERAAHARRAADHRSTLDKVNEDLEPALQKAVEWGITALVVLVLLAIATLIAWRPCKRLLVVQLLRRPLGEVSSTRRIANGWRLVELALGDIGVEPRRGEPAQSLCQRALPRLAGFVEGPEVVGLAEAAEIRDRVAYGLGIGPQDVAFMDRVAQWAYDTVWDRLGDSGQLKALYRAI